MKDQFSAHMRHDGRYTIIPKEEPGRRNRLFYEGRFSSNMDSVNDYPLKNDCDKKESEELTCPI